MAVPMTRLPPHPELFWKEDGTPMALGMDDIYFSRDDGLAETRIVFLQGCGLPDRWHEAQIAGANAFTVAELGFGTGLNFLALWQLWARHCPPGAWLNFVSFEGFPLPRGAAAQALAAWPELQEFTAKLIHKWPDRAKGVREIVWPEARLRLILHMGDIGETLPQAQFQADAWFLDGFSPAKNRDMWAETLWPLVAKRSAPGARLGTFTVAGHVRRGLQKAGFEVEKRPGHGRKRERLEARYQGEIEPLIRAQPKRVAIIGAGIAGACLARRLADQGLEPTVFEAAEAVAQGTSGNPLALVMPRLDAGDTAPARLLVDAYLAARAFYQDMPGVETTDVVHRPKDDQEAARFQKMLADPPLGLELLEATSGGVLHKGALILRPPVLLRALLEGIDVRWGAKAEVNIEARTVDDIAFDAIILTNGWQMAGILPWLKLQARLGQVEAYESAVTAPPAAIASGHYALAAGQARLWGASFEAAQTDRPDVSSEAQAENLQALEALAPYWLVEARKAEPLSRAGIRATTPDRLPLIGQVPDFEQTIPLFEGVRHGRAVDADMPKHEGIYLAGGFGSRGFTWAPYAAGLLSAELLNGPMPARKEAREAVSPDRQIYRDLKRGLI